jgi:hypothetical protein
MAKNDMIRFKRLPLGRIMNLQSESSPQNGWLMARLNFERVFFILHAFPWIPDPHLYLTGIFQRSGVFPFEITVKD